MNQMNIYDWLYPNQIQPMRELAKIAEPHYQESRQRLIELNKEDPDMNRWAAAVKKEYIPHGHYGHHEPGNSPNTIQAYTMQTDHISVDYTDHEGTSGEQFRLEEIAGSVEMFCKYYDRGM